MDVGRDGAAFVHEPVMATEVVETFGPVPAGTVVDATVGGGGHAALLLEGRDDIDVVGLDRDPVALAAAERRLRPYGNRVRLLRRRFDAFDAALDELGVDAVVGVLFDLGVSSPQLDEPDRGFSYRAEAPLDMRMDPDATRSAAELVNELDAGELVRVLQRNADERFARRIAAAIVAARPVNTTTELAEIVRSAIPAAARRRGGHPAKRTFQALRIAVNDELDVLAPALRQAIERLAPGGRGAVLSYHSGEDRIVKQVLRDAEVSASVPRGLPVEPEPTGEIVLLGRGGRVPSDDETRANPRAASARLRAFEKVGAQS